MTTKPLVLSLLGSLFLASACFADSSDGDGDDGGAGSTTDGGSGPTSGSGTGSNDDGDDGSGGGTGGGSDASTGGSVGTGTSGGTSGSSGSDDGGTSGPETTTPPTTTTGPNTTTPPGTTTGPATTTPPGTTTGPATTTTEPPVPADIFCGGTRTCNFPPDICCYDSTNTSGVCVLVDDNPCRDEESDLRCDEHDDCAPGQVCCHRRFFSFGANDHDTRCQDACADNAFSEQAAVCYTPADCPNVGDSCVDIADPKMPEGYNYCQP